MLSGNAMVSSGGSSSPVDAGLCRAFRALTSALRNASPLNPSPIMWFQEKKTKLSDVTATLQRGRPGAGTMGLWN